jgi:hypothetical protein
MRPEFPHTGADLESPENVDKNIYDPDISTGKSLDVINGHLDYTNLELGDSPLPLSAIRRGALFRGKMVGSTLNADYHKRYFNWRSSNTVSDTTNVRAVPGTGIEVYSPTTGLLLLSWQISYSSDIDVKRDAVESYPDLSGDDLVEYNEVLAQQRSFVTLMGAKGTNDLEEIGYRQYLPMSIEPDRGITTTIQGQNILGQGRTWTGHHVVDAKSKTWYRYGIGVLNTANLMRIRVRNFKYLYFPNAPDIDLRHGAATFNGL